MSTDDNRWKLVLKAGFQIVIACVPDNISIKIDLDSRLENFFFDPDKIRLVLHNLIINALQAMLEGGTLKIKSKSLDKEVQFTIQDTGIGIQEKDKAKIFEPLFTTKAKGIGLGLSIVKNQVELHTGKIYVESIRGKGTKFSFKRQGINIHFHNLNSFIE